MSEATNERRLAGDTRFRKGQSGNPRGRPRKREAERAPSAFEVLVGKELTVTRDGVPQQVSLEEALQHQTLRDALAGKRMAQRQLLKIIEGREKALAKRATPHENGIEVVQEPIVTNADEALLLLGIARRGHFSSGENLSLEPWAVQAAIDRLGGRTKIDDKDWKLIRYYTADGQDVRWPREAKA